MKKIHVFEDGKEFCACFDDFKNLQESSCSFGITPELALYEFMRKQDFLIFRSPQVQRRMFLCVRCDMDTVHEISQGMIVCLDCGVSFRRTT